MRDDINDFMILLMSKKEKELIDEKAKEDNKPSFIFCKDIIFKTIGETTANAKQISKN